MRRKDKHPELNNKIDLPKDEFHSIMEEIDNGTFQQPELNKESENEPFEIKINIIGGNNGPRQLSEDIKRILINSNLPISFDSSHENEDGSFELNLCESLIKNEYGKGLEIFIYDYIGQYSISKSDEYYGDKYILPEGFIFYCPFCFHEINHYEFKSVSDWEKAIENHLIESHKGRKLRTFNNRYTFPEDIKIITPKRNGGIIKLEDFKPLEILENINSEEYIEKKLNILERVIDRLNHQYLPIGGHIRKLDQLFLKSWSTNHGPLIYQCKIQRIWNSPTLHNWKQFREMARRDENNKLYLDFECRKCHKVQKSYSGDGSDLEFGGCPYKSDKPSYDEDPDDLIGDMNGDNK